MPKTTTQSAAAILLIGHGTRRAAGISEFHQLVQKIREALLELAEPTVSEALQYLRRQGLQQITVVPIFLMAAAHIKQDIPSLLHAFQTKYPEMSISVSEVLGMHPHLLQVAQERIASIEHQFGAGYTRNDTLLLVIGRGCSDSDVNANLSKITRLLWESMGFAWAETAYTAVAVPLIADALERTQRLGFARVLVFPYLLFDGRLVNQIRAAVADYQQQHPAVPALIAPYLSAHPLVIATVLERIAQAEN